MPIVAAIMHALIKRCNGKGSFYGGVHRVSTRTVACYNI